VERAGPTSILVNHVYYSPVGHVVEAMRYARGFHAANPGSEVHVALSDGAPWELCAGAPWIAGVYRVPVADPNMCDLSIPEMPREWDYIVDNNLMRLEDEHSEDLVRPDAYEPPARGWEEEATIAYYARADAELLVRRGRGLLFPEMSLPEGLRYDPRAYVTLDVPARSRAFAERYAHDGPKICVLPAGSGPAAQYPGPQTWVAILDALRSRLPRARFYLTGSRASGRHPNLTTTRYDAVGLARILSSGSSGSSRSSGSATSSGYSGGGGDVVDCYDIGMWNQVALLEACDLVVSPHSGFSFLAMCVGTPWLTISGGNWPEYFFNGVPFYSVLPDNPDYPYVGAYEYDYDGPTIPDMEHERLVARFPDLLDGAAFLLDPATTYEDALRRHRANVARARIRHDRMPEAMG
jgi:hypothetical protein